MLQWGHWAAGAVPTWSIMAPVVDHKRLQRGQVRQHRRQRAVIYMPQRQMRQAAELRPVLQLHAFEHPVQIH